MVDHCMHAITEIPALELLGFVTAVIHLLGAALSLLAAILHARTVIGKILPRRDL
jgi:hypothetical protein